VSFGIALQAPKSVYSSAALRDIQSREWARECLCTSVVQLVSLQTSIRLLVMSILNHDAFVMIGEPRTSNEAACEISELPGLYMLPLQFIFEYPENHR
jgi:hypothetical protein